MWLMGRGAGKQYRSKFSNFIVACHKYARLGQHLTKDPVERPSAQTAFWYAIGCSACWFYGESILRLVLFLFFSFFSISPPFDLGQLGNTAQEILVYQWNIVKSVYLRDFYVYYRFQFVQSFRKLTFVIFNEQSYLLFSLICFCYWLLVRIISSPIKKHLSTYTFHSTFPKYNSFLLEIKINFHPYIVIDNRSILEILLLLNIPKIQTTQNFPLI